MAGETPTEVTHVLPPKMGGVFNFVDNMITHRQPGRCRYRLLLTINAFDKDQHRLEPIPGAEQIIFRNRLPTENVCAVLKRLSKCFRPGPGTIVANDWIELASLSAHPTEKLVIAITHADIPYYYEMNAKHQDDIDIFATYSLRMADELRKALPNRVKDIRHIPFGVTIPETWRQATDGPLRLLFVGRFTEQKGVVDLPLIDRELQQRGVKVEWTLVGAGPQERELKESWPESAAYRWTGYLSMAEVLKEYPKHDVLMMPSRAEGLPVALVEAAAAGLVPVVSDLPSGIPEVVHLGKTGYRCPIGDIKGYVDGIEALDRDRDRLNDYSGAIRELVQNGFDIRKRALQYEELNLLCHDGRNIRPKRGRKLYGSRLDQPWLPNALVLGVRSVRRAITGTNLSKKKR